MPPLQDSYDDYARQIQRVLYVETKALQSLLHTLGAAKPEPFIDPTTLQKIARSGFVEELYGG
jgi:hypothetical protein